MRSTYFTLCLATTITLVVAAPTPSAKNQGQSSTLPVMTPLLQLDRSSSTSLIPFDESFLKDSGPIFQAEQSTSSRSAVIKRFTDAPEMGEEEKEIIREAEKHIHLQAISLGESIGREKALNDYLYQGELSGPGAGSDAIETPTPTPEYRTGLAAKDKNAGVILGSATAAPTNGVKGLSADGLVDESASAGGGEPENKLASATKELSDMGSDWFGRRSGIAKRGEMVRYISTEPLDRGRQWGGAVEMDDETDRPYWG